MNPIYARKIREGQRTEINGTPVEIVYKRIDTAKRTTVVRLDGRADDGSIVWDFFEPYEMLPLLPALDEGQDGADEGEGMTDAEFWAHVNLTWDPALEAA